MCRLFGLSAAPSRVGATFWLVDASDSLAVQSRREPDGVGLGVYTSNGVAEVHKRPMAAYEDAQFAREAKELTSTTFVAHVRFASTGGLRPENTHPFSQDDRLFAHNGVVQGLELLEHRIAEVLGGPYTDLVHGETDSERVFALITALARRDGGDLRSALVEAVSWVRAHVPVYALNLVLTTPTDLWALRYPDTHPLYVLPREPGGASGGRHLEQASARGTVRVRSGDLAGQPAVVLATERMDEDPRWRLLESGELLHVAADHRVTSHVVLPDPPAHRMTTADLDPHAAASQQP